MPSLRQRASIKCALEEALRLPVDVVAESREASATPFQAIALAKGIPIGETP